MTAVPVRRRDVSLLKQAEDGVGQSLGLTDLMHTDGDMVSEASELCNLLLNFTEI